MKRINPTAAQIANSPAAKLAAKLASSPAAQMMNSQMAKVAPQIINPEIAKAAAQISRIAQPYAEALQKFSHIEWIGKIPKCWDIVKTKRIFQNNKQVAGKYANDFERLALTMNGVIKRDKDDADGLQPESFEGYQVLEENQLVFKLIDLENVKTSRVGLSPYTGIVSPAYIVLKNTQVDNRFFYYYYMNMYYQEIFNYMGGEGVRSALNAKDLLEVPLPKISMTEQQVIADYLDGECARIDGIVTTQRQIIERLKEYKKSVITEAVTRGLNPDAPMRNSGIDWIGKIPEHWEISKLKYYSKYITDGTHTTPEYLADGVPFLSIKDISTGKLDFSNTKYISQQQHEELSKHAPIEKGDILFTRIGTLGVSVIVETDITFDIFVSVGLLKPKDNINTKYLNYVMNSEYYYQYIQLVKAGEGTSAAKFNLSDVSNSPIVCPPLSEQQAISDYLDRKCSEIDSIIEKRELMIELMTEYKKSLIYECVTGKKEIVDVVE